MISTQQLETIKKITAKFGPKLVGVFGSYARGENSKKSDLDVLIEFKQRVNLLDIIGLEQELTEALGIKVDLVTVGAVNEQLRPDIEKDLIRVI